MTETVEQEIQRKGLTAPRVTPEQVEAEIARTDFLVVGEAVHLINSASGLNEAAPLPIGLGLLTICVLTLQNGFTVTGESACASPENFNAEIGRRIARDNAKQKIWPLLGFRLRDQLAFGPAPATYTSIARMAHEVNRAYCQALGDNSQPVWEDAPEWQKNSAIDGVRFHDAHPEAGPEASHENWLAQKRAEGWKYGPVKNPETKEHPCFLPFTGLPAAQQAKDYLFRAVVHAMIPRPAPAPAQGYDGNGSPV